MYFTSPGQQSYGKQRPVLGTFDSWKKLLALLFSKDYGWVHYDPLIRNLQFFWEFGPGGIQYHESSASLLESWTPLSDEAKTYPDI